MNYQETLSYLFGRLPMYQRIGKAAYKTDLKNTIRLCKLLGNPEKKFKSIHIAGTNGKGSTSHMIASVLQESGYKVGLYTSPHLRDFRERIKINGEMIREKDVMTFVATHKEKFEMLDLSFFEWTVGLAFNYFAEEKVDIAIIETGLGGRLDSTNVILPELSVITNISLDHTQFLGSTLSDIAREKAGIIKNNTPVIIGETQIEIKDIFVKKALDLNASILFAEDNSILDYKTDLKGDYQKKNIRTCVQIINILRKKKWIISNSNLIDGFQKVVKNTGLLGRWQILSRNPIIVCDVGHNDAGIREIVKQLEDSTYNKLHIVFGVVNDKSIEELIDLLPKEAHYYFCQAKIDRALDVNELVEIASRKKLFGDKYDNVKQALNDAKKNATENDLIFIGGSTFVVAEVLA